MADRVGATLADVTDSSSVMDTTGEAASAAGTDATTFASQMGDGVNEVTETMRAHFNEVADSMRQQIQQAHQRLMSTDWQGQAKEQAQAAEAQLNSDVDRVLARSMEAVEQFRTLMMNQSQDYVESVRGEFQAVMANINESYTSIAQAERTYVENLQAADQSVRFNG